MSHQTRPALRYGYPWATVGLGPLLLAQGLHTRRTTPRLPEPEGHRQGVAGHGRALRLLIAGDSAAAGVGVTHQDHALSGQLVSALAPHYQVSWRLVAQSGFTTQDIIERLLQTEAAPFDIAVISIGVNDVTRFTSASAWMDWQQRLHELLETRFHVLHVLRSTVPPMHLFPALPQPLRWYLGSRSRHYNDELRTFLQGQPLCDLVQTELGKPGLVMASDGFHPGPNIYQAWAEHLAGSIRERWPGANMNHAQEIAFG